ncbi:FimV/HubP family polar landmark protein [Rudaea sp.]|uniref:type IV pilus assembly protein FimV n=1 Tax=Rudaea sp. TaxID=2136325 RepID=UPI002ED634D9
MFADSPGELADLRVALAPPQDFTRLGLSRERVTVPIEFVVGRNARGELTIKLTTKEVVREPFLDLLIEAEWANGRLLREYAVLLDPPTTLPAIVPALAEKPKPVAAPKPASALVSGPGAPPSVKANPLALASGGTEYLVRKGDTLWAIASRLPAARGVSLDQTMRALFEANPTAFYRRDLDSLKAGALLHIPGGADNLASAPRNGPSVVTHDQRRADAAGMNIAQARLKAPAATAPMRDHVREADELKQRVSQLEEIHEKNLRLIALLDSKIAALRHELQSAQAALAATPPPTEDVVAAPVVAKGAFKAAASDSSLHTEVFRPNEATVPGDAQPLGDD